MNKVSIQKGVFVVYPGHGVGRVIDIVEKTISDFQLKLLVLEFVESKIKLSIPLDKASNGGLRSLSSKAALQKSLDILKTPPGKITNIWCHRAQRYAAKIATANPKSVAEVLRDIRKSKKEDLTYSENNLYIQALNLFAHEFSIVENIPMEDARKRVEEILKSP